MRTVQTLFCKLFIILGILHVSTPGRAALSTVCKDFDFRPGQRITAELVNSSDGDTIAVRYQSKSMKVRLLSVDTPETHFQGKSQGQWGEAAKIRTGELLATGHGRVQLTFDRMPCDIYGRALAYVSVHGVDINATLLEEGLAINFCVFPTTARCDSYAQLTREAIQRNRGFHADSRAEIPYEFRTRESGRPEAEYVAKKGDRTVLPWSDRNKIAIADRIFFITARDVAPPYALP